jgi:hypothetical protein
MGTYTNSYVYALTHSINFLSDNLRNTLREVIWENGLDPNKLVQEWADIQRGIRAWLESRDLKSVIVEFSKPNSSKASARWEFPVGYDGTGVDDDMWLDKAYLRQLIAKSARPTRDCTYRVVLSVKAGASAVPGFSDCTLLSTGQLAAFQAGTVIATRHMTAGATYWG